MNNLHVTLSTQNHGVVVKVYFGFSIPQPPSPNKRDGDSQSDTCFFESNND